MTSMGTKPLGRPAVHDGSVNPAAQCYLTSPADAALDMQVLEAIAETQGAREELAGWHGKTLRRGYGNPCTHNFSEGYTRLKGQARGTQVCTMR